MMKAWEGLEKWKRNVMFIVGLGGMGSVTYWFVAVADKPGMVPLIGAGGIFLISAFFTFPLGITRFLDKFLPGKWR